MKYEALVIIWSNIYPGDMFKKSLLSSGSTKSRIHEYESYEVVRFFDSMEGINCWLWVVSCCWVLGGCCWFLVVVVVVLVAVAVAVPVVVGGLCSRCCCICSGSTSDSPAPTLQPPWRRCSSLCPPYPSASEIGVFPTERWNFQSVHLKEKQTTRERDDSCLDAPTTILAACPRGLKSLQPPKVSKKNTKP